MPGFPALPANRRLDRPDRIQRSIRYRFCTGCSRGRLVDRDHAADFEAQHTGTEVGTWIGRPSSVRTSAASRPAVCQAAIASGTRACTSDCVISAAFIGAAETRPHRRTTGMPGTHEELMKNGLFYQRAYELQLR